MATGQPRTPDDVSRYRLSPVVLVRLAGSAFVLLALLAIVVAALVAVTSGPVGVLLGVVGAGLLLMLGGLAWLRWGGCVVRLDPEGYRVRLARGVGVRDGVWSGVAEAVALVHAGEPCVELRRLDGAVTTIRVRLLEGDREEFARDVRDRLRDHGRRAGAATS